MRRLLHGYLGLVARLFYRLRHLGGEVPSTGPVILVANHPNGLVDSVILSMAARRPVSFLAKEPIFRMPVIGSLARAFGAIPVYRAQDGADTERNRDMFRAVTGLLNGGGAVGLFPEGISHDQPELQPLRTGAARMALGAEPARGPGVLVIPVGITYRDKGRFRSVCTVEVGEPLPAPHPGAGDDRETVRRFTAEIDDALRQVTLNLESREDLPLLRLAERIWDWREGHTVQRLRVLADWGRVFAEHSPSRLAEIRRRLAVFDRQLRYLGLKPDHLDVTYGFGLVVRYVTGTVAPLVLGVPVFLLGAAAWMVPHVLTLSAVRLKRPDPDQIATVKLLAAMLFYPPWYVGLVVWVTTTWGWPWAAAAALALPPSGLVASRFLPRWFRAWRDIRAFLGRPFQRGVRESLERERAEIAEELRRLREETG